jgi:hypothetical protein
MARSLTKPSANRLADERLTMPGAGTLNEVRLFLIRARELSFCIWPILAG